MAYTIFVAIVLFVFGLIFGSFVNALVWRLHEQLDKDGNPKKLSKKRQNEVSILYGRSMCPRCKHELAPKDLVPVISWLLLRGRCRYCRAPISIQYPAVELITGALFVISYVAWPVSLQLSWQIVQFVTWLAVLVGLIALAVYDIKWMLLPDRIVSKLAVIVFLSFIFQLALGRPISAVLSSAMGIAIGGGIYWLLFQVSNGNWIGGGDVKLGALLGFVLGTGQLAFLAMFFASIFGIAWIAPGILAKKLTKNSRIPFGPFLIAGAIFVVLWGQRLIDWYANTFLGSV